MSEADIDDQPLPLSDESLEKANAKFSLYLLAAWD